MRNRNFTSKQFHKLKKKKSAFKQQSIRKHLSAVPSYSFSKNPAAKNSGKGRLKWGVPTILVGSTAFIILVIPTIIVVPSISKSAVQSETIEQQAEYEDALASDSAVEVAVMRTQTEQIENVPLETYVSRVVASEMPVEFETEALKAQALAARTYIVNQMLYPEKEESSDVTDTIQDQVYKDEVELRERWGNKYDQNMGKITEAVLATKGQILTYNDEPITVQFFSTSNGYTENSEDYWTNEIPYLRSVPSPWDEVSPYYIDQETFTLEEVEAALGIDLPSGKQLTIEATRTESHRVEELNLAGNTLTGREVREKLELRSNDFTIEQKNNHLIFTTKGNGHGVGMSQYGANGMAQEGKNYEEIVKYYYQGIDISNLDDAVPALVMQ
ncbi:stage II sporulation protein D [Ornithinibacillus contaminans]|uniref:stage II sporulation protein D n=1 Tax=Ornithinibacillus contaminans TaxID=694055 RepID=UPI0009FB38DC|nr:stage II sporulation protein D [Ornithinibacillus contaminans]